jgi:hypothetical protein
VREFDPPSLLETLLDAPQSRLDRTSRQLPGSGQGGATLRVIAQVVGELGARTSVAQAAGLINDDRVRGPAVFEALQILEIRAGDLIPQPPLHRQGNSLPSPEVSRIALGRRVEPGRIGKHCSDVISHEQTDCIADTQAFRPRVNS